MRELMIPVRDQVNAYDRVRDAFTGDLSSDTLNHTVGTAFSHKIYHEFFK